MTIFVIPPLILLLFLMEFKVHYNLLSLYFKFLDNYIGKGLYIIMMALINIETPKITEIIFCVIISAIGFYNIAYGIAETVIDQKISLSDSSSI